MTEPFDYKILYTNIIRRQIAILGPQLAVARARSVEGLTINDSGAVTAYDGDSKKVLNDLISSYVAIFGTISLESIKPLIESFPDNHSNAAISQ